MPAKSKRASTTRAGDARAWRSTGLVTLTTDFGTADGYVGAMKGVISSLAPRARIIDVSHDIAPGDVLAGALALEAAAPMFPPGTVHLAVVDPGVGTSRRAIAIATPDAVFVGPDNGLLSLAARHPTSTIALDRTRWHRTPVSPTFHGRDVFAPIAARLAAGASLSALGTRVVGVFPLGIAAPRLDADLIVGEVLHVDRFGNLVTNISSDDLAGLLRGGGRGGLEVHVGRRRIGALVRTYGDVEAGQLAAMVGSGGRLEVAARDGSAAVALGVKKPGRVVRVRRCLRAVRG